MKIVVVHGDNTSESRKRFAHIVSGVKKKGWESVFLKPDDRFSFRERLTSNALFDDNMLFVVEETHKLSPNELKWLENNHENYDSSVLLYSNKNLSAATLKSIPKSAKIEKFEAPKILFSFLDTLFPGNSKIALQTFEKVKSAENMEFILAMMARTFRDLYWILIGAEGLNYPDWRINKLRNVATKYTKENLKDIIGNLADIDVKSKTSDADACLLIEMLIIEKL